MSLLASCQPPRAAFAAASAPRAAGPAVRQLPAPVSSAPRSSRSGAVVPRAQAGEPSSSNPNVCPTCGVDKSKAPGGCDMEGRVVGGMGALPGFGWWPIKAYKPCPALFEAGLEYERKGQLTNEVLFGGVSLGPQGSRSLDEIKKTSDKGIRIK